MNFIAHIFIISLLGILPKKSIAQVETLPIEEQSIVLIEENFGPQVKTVRQALELIERKYAPYDKSGRTFAIFEATGYKMPDGKIHLELHVSTEKEGEGWLVLKSSKKKLWHCVVTSKEGRRIAKTKALKIYIEQSVNGKKQFLTADGSNNPASIFQTKFIENGKSVNDAWAEGTSKEVMMIYSACGCPLHAKFLRAGMGTKLKDKNQVLFPDDQEIAKYVKQLLNF